MLHAMTYVQATCHVIRNSFDLRLLSWRFTRSKCDRGTLSLSLSLCLSLSLVNVVDNSTSHFVKGHCRPALLSGSFCTHSRHDKIVSCMFPVADLPVIISSGTKMNANWLENCFAVDSRFHIETVNIKLCFVVYYLAYCSHLLA